MADEGIKVVHALPGRVRLKVAKVKGNPELAGKAQKKLAAVPGIERVEANATTGSLLILYDLAGLLATEALEALAAVSAEFFPEIEALTLVSWLTSLADNPGSGTNPAGALSQGVKAINVWLGKVTGGLDLKLLVPLTLFFFGVRGLLASEKKNFPAWYDYFWFAFSSFIMLNRGLVEGSQENTASSP